MKAAWYVRRFSRMSAREIGVRSAVAARQWWWSDPARRPDLLRTLLPGPHRPVVSLPRGEGPRGPETDAAVQAAETLLRGDWQVFGQPTSAPGGDPDWFLDPLTGRHAPRTGYCFRVPYRDEAAVGNIKFVWELSRHQPITLLAAAWWLTGDERFALGAARHLRSWWEQNPFLQGVHWVSGIEAGLRLLSWTWIRMLLADWGGVSGLFESNDRFHEQLYGHSFYLSAFHSTGSSANNHAIAEWAGLATASLVFPWFRESPDWAATARTGLAREAEAQTGGDGWNREQASSYHVFVAEMLLAAVFPARVAGQGLPVVETVLLHMLDALAASLDSTGQPPRFGDCDDARGLLVDAPDAGAAAALLDAGRGLFGAAAWWPAAGGSVLGRITGAAGGPEPDARASAAASLFTESGIAILRSGVVWLRCDAGPHGYGSIAAHGHADALSIELRCAGIEILADPGTFCYHGQPAWRSYFRGTRGHSTLVVDERDQATPGGPFLWLTKPASELSHWEAGRAWQASHDGYHPARHHRRVMLDGLAVTVQDWLDAPAPHAVQLLFHLGPDVQASLDAESARLRWPGGSAIVTLPAALVWRSHRGETEPPFGWYSRRFGQREPTTVLAGYGTLTPGTMLTTGFNLTIGET